jgi:hypothetical protein
LANSSAVMAAAVAPAIMTTRPKPIPSNPLLLMACSISKEPALRYSRFRIRVVTDSTGSSFARLRAGCAINPRDANVIDKSGLLLAQIRKNCQAHDIQGPIGRALAVAARWICQAAQRLNRGITIRSLSTATPSRRVQRCGRAYFRRLRAFVSNPPHGLDRRQSEARPMFADR